MISGTTGPYGIFGYPVEHTFSPGMHNAAFAKLGLDACYVPFAVQPENLENAMKSVLPLGIRGLNITVPHKERVLAYLDELSQDAQLIKAVNTIEVKGGKLIGHNTDGRGFLRSLKENARFNPKGKTFFFIGSGGAARAVAFSLALSGAKKLLFRDIDLKKTKALVADLRKGTGTDAESVSEALLPAYAKEADCLINATPLGLKTTDPLPISGEHILRRHLVCDLVYNPVETALLKEAKVRGARRHSGIGMLLYQGVIAFEIWTHRKAPVRIMKNALSRQMSDARHKTQKRT